MVLLIDDGRILWNVRRGGSIVGVSSVVTVLHLVHGTVIDLWWHCRLLVSRPFHTLHAWTNVTSAGRFTFPGLGARPGRGRTT